MTHVVVAQDVMPIAAGEHDIRDYTGLQIFGLCALPLVTFDDMGQLHPLGCSGWLSSQDGTRYSFRISEKIAWSDGAPVTGFHYFTGIARVLKQAGHPSRLLLSDLDGFRSYCNGQALLSQLGITASDHEISFRLRTPNYHFPEFLAAPNFSPERPGEGRYCGPYFAHQIANNVCVLHRNVHFPYAAQFQRVPIDSIEFRLFPQSGPDPFALDAWKKNDIDITCETAFPFTMYKSLNTKSTLHTRRIRLCALLALGETPIPNVKEVVQRLDRAIKRAAIAKEFAGVPLTCNHFSDIFRVPRTEESNEDDSSTEYLGKKEETRLVVGYEEFYPNRQILDLVANDAKQVGIMIIPVAQPYGIHSTRCHLRLRLVHSIWFSPLVWYKSRLVDPKMAANRGVWEALRKYVSKYQATSDQGRLRLLADKIDSIVELSRTIVPIIELPGIYLKREGIATTAPWHFGKIWERSIV